MSSKYFDILDFLNLEEKKGVRKLRDNGKFMETMNKYLNLPYIPNLVLDTLFMINSFNVIVSHSVLDTMYKEFLGARDVNDDDFNFVTSILINHVDVSKIILSDIRYIFSMVKYANKKTFMLKLLETNTHYLCIGLEPDVKKLLYIHVDKKGTEFYKPFTYNIQQIADGKLVDGCMFMLPRKILSLRVFSELRNLTGLNVRMCDLLQQDELLNIKKFLEEGETIDHFKNKISKIVSLYSESEGSYYVDGNPIKINNTLKRYIKCLKPGSLAWVQLKVFSFTGKYSDSVFKRLIKEIVKYFNFEGMYLMTYHFIVLSTHNNYHEKDGIIWLSRSVVNKKYKAIYIKEDISEILFVDDDSVKLFDIDPVRPGENKFGVVTLKDGIFPFVESKEIKAIKFIHLFEDYK